MPGKEASPFSFDELRQAGRDSLAPLGRLNADDGARLAFRSYMPPAPRAALLFLHGGGAHSGVGYQLPGAGLRDGFGVAVYTPDLRGHGASDGARGDCPGPQRVWADVGVFIRHLRAAHPGLPLVLGGHSSGAGLALNYSAWAGREAVDAYAFLSPELGYRSATARAGRMDFAAANVPAFIANGISGGRLFGHYPAVRFSYPAEALEAEPGLLSAYSVNMALAVTPFAPERQFRALDRAFGLWIGGDDELLDPGKVLAYAALAPVPGRATVIPGAKHLSVLVRAHESMGPWISGLAVRAQDTGATH